MGYMEEKTLGNKLDAFIKLYSQDFELGYVDYLGINIPSVLDGELTFKIYYINKVSRQVSHPLINFLEEKGMIRYVTMVRDKKNGSRATERSLCKKERREEKKLLKAVEEKNQRKFGRKLQREFIDKRDKRTYDDGV